jgi:hypothetical protein
MFLDDPYLSTAIVAVLLLSTHFVDRFFTDTPAPIEYMEVHIPLKPLYLEEVPKYTGSYDSPLWPSPRPVNFVKALGINYRGRITHKYAIDLLASYAEIPVNEFLKVNPLIYLKVHMPKTDPFILIDAYNQAQLNTFLNREKLMESIRLVG